jgi:lysozyme
LRRGLPMREPPGCWLGHITSWMLRARASKWQISYPSSETGDILLVVDFEVYERSQPTAAQAAAAVVMVKSVTGRLPVLYTGRYVLSSPNSMLSQCPLWLAEYGSRPICPPGWSQWKLWQHTDGRVGSGPMTVPGIGPCDRSRFAGTVDELRAWWPTARA